MSFVMDHGFHFRTIIGSLIRPKWPTLAYLPHYLLPKENFFKTSSIEHLGLKALIDCPTEQDRRVKRIILTRSL